MHRAVFAAPNYLFALALFWAMCVMAISLDYDPGLFKQTSYAQERQQAELAAGLSPLVADGKPELRLWLSDGTFGDKYPSETIFVVTERGITRHRLWEGVLLRRYAVASDQVGDAKSAQRILRSLDRIQSLDGAQGAWCVIAASDKLEWVVDGRRGSYGSQFHCDDTPDLARKIFELVRAHEP